MVSLLKAWKINSGRDTVRHCRLLTSFQEGLEGDRGRDRVQRCRLLTSFQEGPHQKLFQEFFQNSASKMVHCIIVDIVNYLMLLENS